MYEYQKKMKAIIYIAQTLNEESINKVIRKLTKLKTNVN
mgnify:CR=1 FL=1|jgi:hypothetical protein